MQPFGMSGPSGQDFSPFLGVVQGKGRRAADQDSTGLFCRLFFFFPFPEGSSKGLDPALVEGRDDGWFSPSCWAEEFPPPLWSLHEVDLISDQCLLA